jgi:hypothetical protein
MADIKTITSDPDFWGPDTTDEQRSFVLSKNDKNFAAADKATQAKLLKSLGDQNRQGQQIGQKEIGAAEQHQSLFNQYVAQPLNNVVGRAMEAVTTPLVAGVRMAQGVAPGEAVSQAVGTLGAGGEAKRSREQAAAAVVPQEPWQAALMAAGPLGKVLGGVAPVLNAGTKLGALARTGLAAGLGAAGEAALGQTGQEGDTALRRALKGGAKAGTFSAGVEGVAGLSGLLGRHGPGATARIAAEDQGKTAKAIGETVPEFAGAPSKGPQYGQFFQGGGAKSAAEQAFASRVEPLDDLVSQQPKWIQSGELQKAYNTVVKTYKGKPGADALLNDIAPDPKLGFLPSQAAKIMARYREAIVGSGNERMSGHIAQEMVDEVLKDVIRNMPSDVAQKFLQAREGFAAASSVRDLMDKGFQRTQKGYILDIRGPQTEIENPEVTRRLPDAGAKIREAVMRGKNTPPGSVDVMPKNSGYVPFPSVHGAEAAAVKYGTHGRKFVGQKPLTASPGERGTLKALLGSAASVVSKKTKKEE